MDINLELYKVFYYVATTLSFSEASRQLFISQSAVSQSIKTLEKKLNHPLFSRSTKKVLLAPEGELLLQQVKPYFLNDYLQKFHQTYPDVRIKVTNSTSIGCAELLEKGQADLIVCNCPNSRLGSHFQTRVLKEFHDVFVANTDYFPVHTVQTELQELLNYPILMLSPKSTTSEYLREAFTAHNLKLLPEVELNSNDLLLARIGLGIACVPDYMLKENDLLTPLMLKEPLPGRQLVLAQHDSLTVSQAAERFIEMFTSI